MRVALLHWSAIPLNVENPGGVVRVELSELENHKKAGIRSWLFGTNIIGAHPGLKLLKQYKFLKDKASSASSIEFLARNRDASILHGVNMPIIGLLAPRKSLVHFVNSPSDFHHPTRSWAKERYRNAHFALCSEYNRQEFLNLCPYISGNHIHTLHDGVDATLFSPSTQKKDIDRRMKLFFIGNWCEEKGVHFLLDAVKILEGRRKDFELYLAGSVGYWKTNPEQARSYEALIKSKLAAMKFVRVLGPLQYDKYAATLKEVDIFVNPALWDEPFPLVNLEAASSGIPIVSNAVGGIPELVRDGVNGYLVKDKDPLAFAETVERLLEKREDIGTFGQNGRAIVLNEFCWERHTEKLLNIYKMILG